MYENLEWDAFDDQQLLSAARLLGVKHHPDGFTVLELAEAAGIPVKATLAWCMDRKLVEA